MDTRRKDEERGTDRSTISAAVAAIFRFLNQEVRARARQPYRPARLPTPRRLPPPTGPGPKAEPRPILGSSTRSGPPTPTARATSTVKIQEHRLVRAALALGPQRTARQVRAEHMLLWPGYQIVGRASNSTPTPIKPTEHGLESRRSQVAVLAAKLGYEAPLPLWEAGRQPTPET